MFSFGKRNTGVPALIADIESGSVAVGIAVVGKEKIADVFFSERATLPIAERTQEQIAAALPNVLAEATARVVKKYAASEYAKDLGPVMSVYCVVGAPWVRSRTAKAVLRFPEPRAISEQMVKELGKQALREPSDLDKERVFETNVSRVQLNGYKTAKPAGKHANEIVVTVFESDIETPIRSVLEHALGKEFPGRAINIRSHTRAMLTVLHERTDVEHYTLVTMGSHATSCIVVHKEELAEHAIISEGTATILARAAGEHGLPEETLSLMRMLVSDTCATPACEELKAGIAKIEPELVKVFAEAFGKLAATRRLPNTCFVSVHTDVAPWLEHFLARIDFSPFTITMQPFAVESLTPEHVRELVSWHAGAHEDSGLALAAAFVNMGEIS